MARNGISSSRISTIRGLLNPRYLLNYSRMFAFYEERTLSRDIVELKVTHPTLTDDRLFIIMKKANPRVSDSTILNAISATKKKFNPSLVTPEMQRELDEWDAF